MSPMKRPWLVYGLAFLGGMVLFLILVSFFLTLLFFLLGERDLKGPKIGVLEVKGVILESSEYLKAIEELREREDIKAIVVRIDSPGGSVGAVQEIFEELKVLRKTKPLIVSMGGVAASGGLYLALSGQKIFANPGTITGSIGVMIQLPNFEKLMEKIGISAEVIKSGPYKDTGSAFRGLTSEERKYLQEKVELLHNQFVKAISEERKIPLEKVKAFANGKIYTGEEALKLGLIDGLGNFYRAVDEAKRLSGIKKAVLIFYPRKKGYLERFFEEKIPLKDIRLYDPLNLRALYLYQP